MTPGAGNEQKNEESSSVKLQRTPSLSRKKAPRHSKTQTDLTQAILNARLYIQSTKPAILGGDENILSRETALFDRLTRFGFIAVGLGRIWRRQGTVSISKSAN